MKDVLYVEEIDQAEALFKPQRVDVLRQLAEPRSCTEVGAVLGQSPQRVHYHVKKLVEAGLVDQVGQRRVRALTEGVYQASARAYWLSPKLVGRIGSRSVQDELSLGFLLDLVEEVQQDLAVLRHGSGELPTLGVSGEIRLPADRRQAFLDDLRTTMQDLFARHGGSAGDAVKIALACYPKESADG